VIDGLSVMGPEYTEIIKTAFRDRWIDWADNVGKSTGAFCGGPYGVHPYVLMTWGNEMRGTFTLAHELGHAGHAVLAERNQRLFNCDPSMFFVGRRRLSTSSFWQTTSCRPQTTFGCGAISSWASWLPTTTTS
jgi:oligoendopeptidase F